MMTLARWKVILVLLATILGLLFTLPNLLPAKVRDSLPASPKKTLNLSRPAGRPYLLYSVDMVALRNEKLNNMTEDVRTTFRDKQIAFTDLTNSGGVINLWITDLNQVGDAQRPAQNIDAQVAGVAGGREVTVQQQPDQRIRIAFVQEASTRPRPSGAQKQDPPPDRPDGHQGPDRPPGKDRIVIQAAGESDPNKLKSVITDRQADPRWSTRTPCLKTWPPAGSRRRHGGAVVGAGRGSLGRQCARRSPVRC
jgi:preprotein translocase subunit SecD